MKLLLCCVSVSNPQVQDTKRYGRAKGDGQEKRISISDHTCTSPVHRSGTHLPLCFWVCECMDGILKSHKLFLPSWLVSTRVNGSAPCSHYSSHLSEGLPCVRVRDLPCPAGSPVWASPQHPQMQTWDHCVSPLYQSAIPNTGPLSLSSVSPHASLLSTAWFLVLI